MKKAMLFFALLIITTLSTFAQDKQKADSTPPAKPIVDTDSAIVKVTVGEFKALLSAIDSNVDSKKASKEILDFLQKKAVLLQPADKPKPPKK